MEKEYFTIRELAEMIGVSKTAVAKKIDKLGLRDQVQTTANHSLIVGANLAQTIIDSFAVKQEKRTEKAVNNTTCGEPQTTANQFAQTDNQLAQTTANLIDTLQKQIEEKDRQIETLLQQVTMLEKLLDQQQQLSLVAENRIKEREKIEAPDARDNCGSTTRPAAREAVAAETGHKKWWQFWKS